MREAPNKQLYHIEGHFLDAKSIHGASTSSGSDHHPFLEWRKCFDKTFFPSFFFCGVCDCHIKQFQNIVSATHLQICYKRDFETSQARRSPEGWNVATDKGLPLITWPILRMKPSIIVLDFIIQFKSCLHVCSSSAVNRFPSLKNLNLNK